MTEFYNHIAKNIDTFNFWIENQSRLQISNDIFKPLIPVFQEANPTVNVNACQDCIIDMLIWCRREYKNALEKSNGKFTIESGFEKEFTTFSEKLEETATKIETKHKSKKNGKQRS